MRLLKEQFGISPSSDEDHVAQQTIEATSTFEAQPLSRIRWQDLDHSVARRLVSVAESRKPEELSEQGLLVGGLLRGLIWHEPGSGEHY